MSRAASVAVRLVVAVLLAVGVASAVNRAISVTSADPAALNREQLEVIGALTGLEAGSAEHARVGREISLSTANLNEQPRATLLHVLAGAAFFVLVPLQFSRRIRARHPAVHRWNGRAMLAIVLASTAAGLHLGLARPYGGAWESAATVLFGGLLVFGAARAFLAIRGGDVRLHREWMVRVFALAVAISVIRVLGTANAWAFGTGGINPGGFALSLWIGWILTLAVAEIYILRTRPRPPGESAAPLQDLQLRQDAP